MVSALKTSGVLALGLAICGAGFACSSALDVHAIASPEAHFEQYRAIAFDVRQQAPSQYETSPQSGDVREYVTQVAKGILQARGYRVGIPDSADLVIVVEAGRRERKVVEQIHTPVVGAGPASVSGASSPSGASNTTLAGAPGMETYHGQLDTEERDLVEGAFVIDAFDGKSRQLVWHGAVRAEITPGRVDYERLRHAVESVLASFPARTAP
jgi:hypothetical protein